MLTGRFLLFSFVWTKVLHLFLICFLFFFIKDRVNQINNVTCDVNYDDRAAESTEEVTKLRPARLIQEDGIIRPYNQRESEGCDLFQVKNIHK